MGNRSDTWGTWIVGFIIALFPLYLIGYIILIICQGFRDCRPKFRKSIYIGILFLLTVSYWGLPFPSSDYDYYMEQNKIIFTKTPKFTKGNITIHIECLDKNFIVTRQNERTFLVTNQEGKCPPEFQKEGITAGVGDKVKLSESIDIKSTNGENISSCPIQNFKCKPYIIIIQNGIVSLIAFISLIIIIIGDIIETNETLITNKQNLKHHIINFKNQNSQKRTRVLRERMRTLRHLKLTDNKELYKEQQNIYLDQDEEERQRSIEERQRLIEERQRSIEEYQQVTYYLKHKETGKPLYNKEENVLIDPDIKQLANRALIELNMNIEKLDEYEFQKVRETGTGGLVETLVK